MNSVGLTVVRLRDVLAHLQPGVASAAIVGWPVQWCWTSPVRHQRLTYIPTPPITLHGCPRTIVS
jgi:hypothetical protein